MHPDVDQMHVEREKQGDCVLHPRDLHSVMDVNAKGKINGVTDIRLVASGKYYHETGNTTRRLGTLCKRELLTYVQGM